ncbi:hypothetical protein A3715_11335 [Oleiphilus sp. HI0009]|nr:hypothetical protein A3715_11335 [Oleiphilus sp. HI0009]
MKYEQTNRLYGYKLAGFYWLGSSFLPLKILITLTPVLLYFVFDISDDAVMGLLMLFVALAVFCEVIVGAIYLRLLKMRHGKDVFNELLYRFMNTDENAQTHYDFSVEDIVKKSESS